MKNWQSIEQEEALKKYNDELLQDKKNQSKSRTEKRLNSQQPLTGIFKNLVENKEQ